MAKNRTNNSAAQGLKREKTPTRYQGRHIQVSHLKYNVHLEMKRVFMTLCKESDTPFQSQGVNMCVMKGCNV